VIGVLAVALIVAGLLLYPRSSNSSSSGSGSARVGGSVPHFSLPNLTVQGSVGVSQNGGGSGKPIVLIFFASWCLPCQEETPGLVQAIDEGDAGSVPVLGINALDAKAAAQDFVANHKIPYPVGFDSAGAVTNGLFGFPALPEVVFVNGAGVITEIHYGVTTPAEFKAGIKTLR